MDWLEGPTNNSDPIWDLSPINSLAFDYDYDHYMNDFKDTLNLEPKAYVIQRDGNDDSMHSLAHSFSDPESESSVHLSHQNSNRSMSSFQDTASFNLLLLSPQLFTPNQALRAAESDTSQVSPRPSIPSRSPSLQPATTTSKSTHKARRKRQHRKNSVASSASAAEQEQEPEDVQKSKRKKVAHNIIEKRYRTNLNSKFIVLSNALPNSSKASRNSNSNKRWRSTAGTLSACEQHPPNKSEVLTNALTYILQLKTTNGSLRKELLALKENRLLPRSMGMR